MSTFSLHKRARTSTTWDRQINFSGPSQPGKKPRADRRTNEGKNRVYNPKWQHGSVKTGTTYLQPIKKWKKMGRHEGWEGVDTGEAHNGREIITSLLCVLY